MSQDFSVLLHTPTDGTDGDCTASLKNPRGIEPRRILPQPRGSQAHTCMSPQSSDCLTFIHNLKPSDPSIFFRTPQVKAQTYQMHINSFQHYYWNVNILNFNDLCKFSSHCFSTYSSDFHIISCSDTSHITVYDNVIVVTATAVTIG